MSPQLRRSTLAAILLLAGCAHEPAAERLGAEAPQPFPLERYRDAGGAGTVFWLEPAASAVHVLVYRDGPLARRGHDHVVSAGQLQGAVLVPQGRMDEARFDLVIPVAELQVDVPEVRRRLGVGGGEPLPEEARAGTRRNLLGPAVLDAQRHPTLQLQSEDVLGGLPVLLVRVAITLRGVTTRHWVPVEVALNGARLEARGRLVLRQQDLGLQPFSILGGLLRVADPVVVLFDLVGRARGPEGH